MSGTPAPMCTKKHSMFAVTGLSRHDFSKWHGFLRATFDGTLGKSTSCGVWDERHFSDPKWMGSCLFGTQSYANKMLGVSSFEMARFLILDSGCVMVSNILAYDHLNDSTNLVPTVQALLGVGILRGLEVILGDLFLLICLPIGMCWMPAVFAWFSGIDPLVEKNFLGGMPEALDEEEVRMAEDGWRNGKAVRYWHCKGEISEIRPLKRCVPNNPWMALQLMIDSDKQILNDKFKWTWFFHLYPKQLC